jgi:hypothetical protein
MGRDAIHIQRIFGLLRVADTAQWQVRLNFEVAIPGAGVECWNNGTGWTTLGAPPVPPGFEGLRLAADCALTEIEADIERRGCRPTCTFLGVHWRGEDDASRDALRGVVEPFYIREP